MKYTPWFDSSVKPVHVGVYELGMPDDECGGEVVPYPFGFHYWNGRIFTGCGCTPEQAERAKEEDSQPFYLSQSYWRGLTTKDGK
jgi:hypothetical protein